MDMKKIKTIIYILLILILGALAGHAELSILGLTFPTPKFDQADSAIAEAILYDGRISGRIWLQPSDTLLSISPALEKELLFYISSGGTVDSVICQTVDPQNIAGKLAGTLKSFQFQPAKYNGMAIFFILPARLIIDQDAGRPSVHILFPYCDYNDARSRLLIDKALEINNIIPPQLNEFPSYYCPFKEREKIEFYPFSIFRVEIDSIGKLVQLEDICNTFPSYAELLSKVVLYARFQPAKYKEQPISSNLFIIIRFFDRIKYPVSEWPPDLSGVIDFPFDYVRIEPVLYLDSLVNPPYPTNVVRGMVNNNISILFNDTIKIGINIDTMGKVSRVNFNYAGDKGLRSEIEKVVKKIKFTPARDINDNKIACSETLYIYSAGDMLLRIIFPWLPHEIWSLNVISY
jgi:hypothetical protein